MNIDKKSADLEAVNTRFNADLQRHIDGTLPISHIYQLGYPGDILLSAGLEYLPIELSAKKLSSKAHVNYRNHHPFDIYEIMDLPKTINNPIAVFNSTKNDGVKIILTEFKNRKGNNFVVATKVWGKALGRKNNKPVNSIVSLYPKDDVRSLINWINSGNKLVRWMNKEKTLNFVSTQSTNLIASGNSIQGINPILIDYAKNEIQNFQNPIYP